MDKDDRPLSFAVPRGAGGVFERLFAGDIDWKAALVWLMLKLHSDWTTGITDKNRMADVGEVGRVQQTEGLRRYQNSTGGGDAQTLIGKMGGFGVPVVSEAVREAGCPETRKASGREVQIPRDAG